MKSFLIILIFYENDFGNLLFDLKLFFLNYSLLSSKCELKEIIACKQLELT